jgi:hypothetical protein
MSSNARCWVGVGVVSFWVVVSGGSVKVIWSRVRVARWSSRVRKQCGELPSASVKGEEGVDLPALSC